MELVAATPEQVGWFKLGAAQRFSERGVPANVAEAILANQMQKVANALGIQAAPQPAAPAPTPKMQKLAGMIASAVGELRKR